MLEPVFTGFILPQGFIQHVSESFIFKLINKVAKSRDCTPKNLYYRSFVQVPFYNQQFSLKDEFTLPSTAYYDVWLCVTCRILHSFWLFTF